jgi:type II secretory pathway pseudopilin PulG
MDAEGENAEPRLHPSAPQERVPYDAITLVVIMIVLLTAVRWLVGPLLSPGAGKNAKGKATEIMLSNFGKALSAYKAAVGRHPTSAEGLRVLVEKPADDAVAVSACAISSRTG